MAPRSGQVDVKPHAWSPYTSPITGRRAWRRFQVVPVSGSLPVRPLTGRPLTVAPTLTRPPDHVIAERDLRRWLVRQRDGSTLIRWTSTPFVGLLAYRC